MSQGHVPAYPQGIATAHDGGIYTGVEKHPDFGGLTKRELFAAMAMQGLVTNTEVAGMIGHQEIIVGAVKLADALLAELEKGK